MCKSVDKIEVRNLRKYIIAGVILFLLGSLVSFFMMHNNSLYKKEILKVVKVEQKVENKESHAKEKKIRQNISGEILNGKNKGKHLEITHRYSSSQVYDDKYSQGDKVFIEKSEEGYSITGLKRDYYVVFMMSALLSLLVIVAGFKGFTTFISLIINLIILWLALKLHLQGVNLVLVTIVSVILFAFMLLVFNTGLSKKTYSAMISTILTLFASIAVMLIVMKVSPSPNYEFFEYLPQPYDVYDAKLIFISSIIITGLGAVMDIAVTMTSLVSEILRKNPKVSAGELKKSCTKVGDDVLGTMINVVFFSNVAAAIPFFILSLKNDIDIDKVLKYNVFFDIVRFLTGSIATVLAIPVAALVAVKMFRKREEL